MTHQLVVFRIELLDDLDTIKRDCGDFLDFQDDQIIQPDRPVRTWDPSEGPNGGEDITPPPLAAILNKQLRTWVACGG